MYELSIKQKFCLANLNTLALVSTIKLFLHLPKYFAWLSWYWKLRTLWFQLEDMFQLIVTPQGIEKVTIQLKHLKRYIQ